MTVWTQLRRLVLGETWIVPLGVAAVLVLGLLAQLVLPDAWSSVGGFLMLSAVVVIVVVSVGRSGRG